MEQTSLNKKREIVATLAVLIVIVAIVAAVTVTNRKKVSTVNTDPAPTSTSTPTNTPSTNPSSTTSASSYKDGSYSATGSYDSPGGNERITVHVTLANDVVTATSATSGAGDPEAEEYQNDFIAGYKQLVVGKDIVSVHLSRVSGSSLTSQGFNDALAQIKQQAKA